MILLEKDRRDFCQHWNDRALDVLDCAKAHGWASDQHEAVSIALMHSELSEALEAYRHGNPASEHIPEFTAVEEEMADVVIRIMDHCAARGHRVADAILAKIVFNTDRPHKHGGKKF